MDDLTFDIPYAAKNSILEADYEKLFAFSHSGDVLRAASDHDLDRLYQAAYLVAFYTFDPKYVRDMGSVLDELQRRGAASEEHYAHMHEMLLKTRRLDEAREFARLHPSPKLPKTPELREPSRAFGERPTELAVDPSTHQLVRRAVDLHLPAQVVVVASPMCHFSQDAMRAIQQDPVLEGVLRAHAIWLAPQDVPLDVDVFEQWNRTHLEATWAFRRIEWPMIDYWGTPTFYFLQNGVVQAKVTGWPKEGRRAELLAALRQVGLLQ